MPLQQFLPGECGRLARENLAQGSIRQRERPGELIKLDLAGADALRPQRKRLHDAAQARIAGERCDQGLRACQPFGVLPNLGGRSKQQSVAFEEGAAVGLAHRRKQPLVCRKTVRQRVGCHFGILGSGCFHDDGNAVLREGLAHYQLTLMPGEILRNQSFDIRIDGESCGGERAGDQH